MRRALILLALVAGLGLALAVGFGVEDARQAALLDARIHAADTRVSLLIRDERQLVRDGAPEDRYVQLHREEEEAWKHLQTLRTERWRRQQSWHVRLLREFRRRTGW
jgi:hypothetical protein